MYISQFKGKFHKRCLASLKSKLEYVFENPSASGLIVFLSVASLTLNFYCLFFIFPVLLGPSDAIIHWLFCTVSNLLCLGILGHLYVLSQDDATVLVKMLRIDNDRQPNQRDNIFGNYENFRLRLNYNGTGSLPNGNENDHTLPNANIGKTKDVQLKQLGLILYLTCGAFLAFVVCLADLYKTEGPNQTLLLLVKSMLFLMSYHVGSIVTMFTAAAFVSSLIFLIIYLKTAMAALALNTQSSKSSFVALLNVINESQSVRSIIIPNVFSAFYKNSTLLPHP